MIPTLGNQRWSEGVNGGLACYVLYMCVVFLLPGPGRGGNMICQPPRGMPEKMVVQGHRPIQNTSQHHNTTTTTRYAYIIVWLLVFAGMQAFGSCWAAGLPGRLLVAAGGLVWLLTTWVFECHCWFDLVPGQTLHMHTPPTAYPEAHAL